MAEYGSEEEESVVTNKDQRYEEIINELKRKIRDLEAQLGERAPDGKEDTNELHVAFMHASPIVFKDHRKNRLNLSNVPLLDFMSDWKTIKVSLKQTE